MTDSLSCFSKIYKKLMKNGFVDNLIYKISGEMAVYETFTFKTYLYLKKIRYVSAFNPIVIGGCPRSGTTLARALIGTHPKIASLKKEYNLLIGLENKTKIKKLFDFSEKEIYDLYGKHRDIAHLSEKILKKYIEKQRKNLVLLKHPHHIMIINELFRYFPKLRFIHIIRDGRDTVCSLKTHPKKKIVDGKIIETDTRNPMNWCIRRWIVSINQGKRWRGADNYIEIKYEDLIKNPIDTLRKIYGFLNLEMINKGEILNFYKYEKDKDHPRNIEVGKELYNKSVCRWKKDMNSNEKKLFKNMAGLLLIELGYEKDLKW